jgi:hypothetical protein
MRDPVLTEVGNTCAPPPLLSLSLPPACRLSLSLFPSPYSHRRPVPHSRVMQPHARCSACRRLTNPGANADDRSSIQRWLDEYHDTDPLTNTKIDGPPRAARPPTPPPCVVGQFPP